MNQTNASLTREELLHLAIESARRGDHGSAISYLKDGTSRFPSDAKLAYLLGAEYAQIGLYDNAESEMQRSIELDPELLTACFQLGLLQLTQGRPDAAKDTWQKLNKLPVDNALYLFKSGLQELAENQYHKAHALLKQGIAANNFSVELNRDMETVLSAIPLTTDNAADSAPISTEHMWLSAYRTEQGDKEIN
jgi:tetratricopeptide (TPR) repeat protein